LTGNGESNTGHPNPDWRQLWAKTRPGNHGCHPLWKHLIDVSAVSLALPNPLRCFGWYDLHVAFIVALHDIGKADSVFQHQVPELSEKILAAGFPITGDAPVRHERHSARFLGTKLQENGHDRFVIAAITRATLAHHGHWSQVNRPVAKPYARAQDALWRMMQEVLGVDELPRETPSDLSAFGMCLTGHTVLCDWIASNEEFFTDDRLARITSPNAYFAQAKTTANEWIDGLGFERDNGVGQPSFVVEKPRPIQRLLLNSKINPALVIVEAPMGEGKTEAAWILAEKWRTDGYHGMYMALPSMATSDSLHHRYRDHYLSKLGRGEDVKLVHGMAWLRDEREPEQLPHTADLGDDRDLAAAWFRPTRRAMLAPHGVGTVDQAMLAGMHVKFGFLRLFGLTNKVLIIDEVHAYDAYMSTIIGRLLQWCACLKIPVILLSATLSAKQRAAMIEAY